MDCYLITTYNRSKFCRELIKQLHGDVYILDDGSSEDYTWAEMFDLYYKRQRHKGKYLYTETVNSLFEMPVREYDYYFMIPDDFMPVENFADKAKSTWKKIKDNKKICLTTYVDQGRLNKPCWTNFTPIENKSYRQTQWTDMCFMSNKEFFDAVGEIPYSKFNWLERPEMSSGVGSLISSKLHKEGYHLYQTLTSLFVPRDVDSKMNTWRDREDLINKPVL